MLYRFLESLVIYGVKVEATSTNQTNLVRLILLLYIICEKHYVLYTAELFILLNRDSF